MIARVVTVLVVTFSFAALAGGCSPKGKSAAPSRGFLFVERAEAAGVDFRHSDGSSGQYYIVETLASGLALVDIDDDGDLDLYLLTGRKLPPASLARDPGGTPGNRLYLGDGKGSFRDVTAAAGVPGVGYSIGCCAGDYDGDGDLDLYVAGFGPNVLYANQGDGTFRDVTEAAGVDDTRFSAGCAFVDIDLDGDLDLYVSNYCEVDFEGATPCENGGVPSYCPPKRYPGVADSLFLNEGDGTFRDISESSGIAQRARWGMGVVATDFDADGLPDIYVANDVSENFLFRNLGGGRFEEIAMTKGVALSSNGDEQGSMGVAAADYDADGRVDIFVTNYQKQLNALYHQEGDVGFSDIAMASGLGADCLPLVSWGTGFRDFDADGRLDLFIANGHLDDRIAEFDQSSTYLQGNQVYLGSESGFREVSAELGAALTAPTSSRGAAFGDIDGDGDIDIVVNNSRGAASVLVNEGGDRSPWIALDLRGKANRFAIGARVTVEANGRRQFAEVRSGGSYVSQSDLRLHFGLGTADRVDRVTVHWPGGGETVREGLESRRVHRIAQD